jgi:hypothetical protein
MTEIVGTFVGWVSGFLKCVLVEAEVHDFYVGN